MTIATSAALASAPADVAAHAFMYVECDIQPGITIDEYRRRRTTKHGPRHFRRLRNRLRPVG
jgi:hypothetical protein